MADVTYIPDANSGQMNNLLPWMLAGNGGFGGFGGGWGTGIVGFILGALVGNNGFGGLFGGNSGMNGAGYVANALNNDTGRELILQAVNGNHEALTNLSNILHTDVASVQSALNTISLGIQNVGSQVGMTGLQVINAIQAGNAEMANQLCKCCCDQRQLTVEQGYQNQLRTVEQTNTLSGAIAGGNQRIVDAIADLKTTTVQEFCAARERDMQEKIDGLLSANSTLRSQIDNAAQTQAFASMLAPINAKLIEIENKQPNTVPVQYPNIVAMNATPYAGFGAGYGYGYGVPGGSYWG